MAFRLPYMNPETNQSDDKNQGEVPKGHLAIYVGDSDAKKKRYVVPISCLSHPAFQGLLSLAEEKSGFHHPTGGLSIPCNEQTFLQVMNGQLKEKTEYPVYVWSSDHVNLL